MPSKKALASEWLAGREFVGPAEFLELRALTGASESHARRLLRESGVRLDPVVEGVRQDSFAAVERTLLAMPDTAEGRRLVLIAKEHARLALRSPKTNRAEKEEMIAWMTVWLETPGAFRAWLSLRKRARGGS
jgi:hypothetical protein